MTAYIGIDVSKHKLDCAWLRDPTAGQVKTRVFRNEPGGMTALVDWLAQHTGQPAAACHVVIEATGVYHEALAQTLYDAGLAVSVVNPAYSQAFAQSLGQRQKTDKKDSVMLARYGAAHQPAVWHPEPRAVRELKDRIARLEALDTDIQRECNRREKAGVAGADQVVASIDTVLSTLRAERDRLARDIDDHIDRHPELQADRDLLASIPGIGPSVSLRLMATLRSRAFTSARQAAAFAGLVPVRHESGRSVQRAPHLSKAGAPALRRRLYMAAVVAMRHNPDVKAQYHRLTCRGKSRMSALGAAMRKLVHIAYGVLKHRIPYQPQIAQPSVG